MQDIHIIPTFRISIDDMDFLKLNNLISNRLKRYIETILVMLFIDKQNKSIQT